MMTLTLTPLAHGAFSERSAAARLALRDQAAWAALWESHARGEAAPVVDFAAHAVLAVFAGQKPSTGWAVELGPAEASGGVLTTRYRVRPPLGMAQDVITSPFRMALVSSAGWERVEFIPG
jgi:hypothetical protein